MSDPTPLPSCPKCSHPHLHRSSPRSWRESALLAVTPVRFYRCHVCMHRGWTTRAVSQSELEDLAARRQQRAKQAASAVKWAIAAAVALAATVGVALTT
jgi:hypothetical protein